MKIMPSLLVSFKGNLERSYREENLQEIWLAIGVTC